MFCIDWLFTPPPPPNKTKTQQSFLSFFNLGTQLWISIVRYILWSEKSGVGLDGQKGSKLCPKCADESVRFQKIQHQTAVIIHSHNVISPSVPAWIFSCSIVFFFIWLYQLTSWRSKKLCAFCMIFVIAKMSKIYSDLTF